MAIRARCGNCGHSYDVDPAHAGQSFDCEECGGLVKVPDQTAARPAARPSSSLGEDRKDGSTSNWSRRDWNFISRLVAGLVLVGLLLGFVGVRVAAWLKRPPSGVTDESISDSDGPPATPVPWTVQVDPLPHLEAATVPIGHTVHIPIPDGPNPQVVFPATPSTMVVVGNVRNRREHWEVWDYRKNRKMGNTPGLETRFAERDGGPRPVCALSPTGTIFITEGKKPFEMVRSDVATGSALADLNSEHAATGGCSFAAFATPQRVVACGHGLPMQLLDIDGSAKGRLQHFPRETEYDRNGLAISPGGRNLAVYHQGPSGSIRLYDLETRLPAGQLSLPEFSPRGFALCDGMSFSPDGLELAGLFVANGKSHLACWNLGEGRLVTHTDFGGNLRSILAAPLAYLYASIEWFPDGQRWLVYGQGVVDRTVGKVIWNIADEPNRMEYGIRHVAGKDCVLSEVREKDGFVLHSLSLPLERLDRITHIAKSVEMQNHREPLSLKKADWSSVRKISFDGPAPDWRLVPDPGPMLDAGSLTHPVSLEPWTGNEFPTFSIAALNSHSGKLLIASQAPSDIAVASAPELSVLNNEIKQRIDPPLKYLQIDDLVSGRRESVVKIPADCSLRAVSTDGATALTSCHESRNRLDLWSLADGRQLLGWEPETNQDIALATIIDPNHVIMTTANDPHEVFCWELQACHVTYRMPHVRGFAMSPTRKYFAVEHDRQFRFYESTSGSCVGAVRTDGVVWGASFHPSGARFACLLERDSAYWLVCWNLKTGRLETEFPFEVVKPFRFRYVHLHWCGDNQLFTDEWFGVVIDVGRRMIVWTYKFVRAYPIGNPGGRHWLLQSGRTTKDPWRLAALTLPDAQVAKQIEKRNPQPELILKPGNKISIEFDGQDPPQIGRDLEQQIRRLVADYYRPHKIESVDGQPLKLRYQWKSVRTRATYNAPRSGLRRQCLAEASVSVVRDGRVHWSEQFQSSWFVPATTDASLKAQGVLVPPTETWNQVLAFFRKTTPPVYVFPTGSEKGLGTSEVSLRDGR